MPSSGFCGVANAPRPLARLEVLGPMRFVRAGAAEPMRAQKRKELLVRLLEARIAGRFGLSQLELIDALYPDAHEGDAARSLQQRVFQTRKRLGASLLIRCGDGYALGAVTSDAEAFLETDDTRLWRASYLANAGTGDEVVAGALHHALRMRMEPSLEAEPAEALPVSWTSFLEAFGT
jgi:DNA-binding SARP family transcriptional activator